MQDSVKRSALPLKQLLPTGTVLHVGEIDSTSVLVVGWKMHFESLGIIIQLRLVEVERGQILLKEVSQAPLVHQQGAELLHPPLIKVLPFGFRMRLSFGRITISGLQQLRRCTQSLLQSQPTDSSTSGNGLT